MAVHGGQPAVPATATSTTATSGGPTVINNYYSIGSPTLVQQNPSAQGQTIYVVFDGDTAPTGLVKGDVVITEVVA